MDKVSSIKKLAPMLMIHGMTCLFHQNRNNLMGFARFIHFQISLIYEPIIDRDLPQ
jgi:hypothetical protein